MLRLPGALHDGVRVPQGVCGLQCGPWALAMEEPERGRGPQSSFARALVSKMSRDTVHALHALGARHPFSSNDFQQLLSKTNKQNNGGICLELFIMRLPKA